MEQNTRELLEAANVIGGALEVPHWVTTGLVSSIGQTGRRVGELKVDELIGLIKAQECRINTMLGSNDATMEQLAWHQQPELNFIEAEK